MSGGLGPYPAYKHTHVPSLGEVPKHWGVVPLGRIGRISKANGGNKQDEVRAGIPCVRYGDLYTTHEFFIRSTRAFVGPESVADYTPIRYGDVLFAASGETIEDIGKSAVNLIESEVRCGGDVLVMRPTVAVVPEFLGYASDSYPARHQKARMGRGFTIVHMYAAQLNRLVLALPPFDEQAAIVRFLDHADRRIRRYVAAKKKLIALLTEQVQAVIHHAVTRGLDPDVTLKSSGVDWLGDMPEHWVVSRVKNEFECLDNVRVPLSATERGAMTARTFEYYGASGVIDRVDDYLFDDDLLLLAEDGANLVLRNHPLVVIARGKFWVNNHAHVLRPRHGNLEFLAYLLESYRYDPWISGAAQPKLTQDRLMNIAMAVPGRDEQDRIVDSVRAETEPMRTRASEATRALALVREYRTRLIADVVTGKLDIRAAAARLPDESEEAEPLGSADDLGDGGGSNDEAGMDPVVQEVVA